MMTVRLSDLPKAVRDRIEAEHGKAAPAKPRRAKHEPGLPLRCLSCGEVVGSTLSGDNLAKHPCTGRFEAVLS